MSSLSFAICGKFDCRFFRNLFPPKCCTSYLFLKHAYPILPPRITLNIIAMTAITSRTWIMLPAANPKYPIAHSIINITATMYNKFPMTFVLFMIMNECWCLCISCSSENSSDVSKKENVLFFKLWSGIFYCN